MSIKLRIYLRLYASTSRADKMVQRINTFAKQT